MASDEGAATGASARQSGKPATCRDSSSAAARSGAAGRFVGLQSDFDATRHAGIGRIGGKRIRVLAERGGRLFLCRTHGVDRSCARRSRLRRQRDAQRIARQHDLAPLRENRLRAQCQLRLIPFLPSGLERDTRERRLAIGQRGPRLQLALRMRQRIPRVGACLRCAQLCGDRAQHGGELLPQHVALALPPERHLHEGRHADAQQDAHHPVADFSEVRGRAELLEQRKREGEHQLEAGIADPLRTRRYPRPERDDGQRNQQQADDVVEMRNDEHDHEQRQRAADGGPAQPQQRTLRRCAQARQRDDQAGQHDRVDALPVHGVVEHVADENGEQRLQRKAHVGGIGPRVGRDHRLARGRLAGLRTACDEIRVRTQRPLQFACGGNRVGGIAFFWCRRADVAIRHARHHRFVECAARSHATRATSPAAPPMRPATYRGSSLAPRYRRDTVAMHASCDA